ncbi:hypothetical protein Tco_1505027 [Tanacetum coccineum]
MLYNAKALVEKHNPVCVCYFEETLILAEESRLKMKEKQTKVNTKPIDYSKLINLYEYFVPQKQLSAEQVYWAPVSNPSPTEKVTKVFPKKLPSTSQVLKNLQNARNLLDKFDVCIKKRTTLSPHEIETLKLFETGLHKEVSKMQGIFHQMEDEVELCSMEKKYFEIEKKQFLINNDRLLEENISYDIMCTFFRSLNEVDNYGKRKSLDIVILDQ